MFNFDGHKMSVLSLACKFPDLGVLSQCLCLFVIEIADTMGWDLIRMQIKFRHAAERVMVGVAMIMSR